MNLSVAEARRTLAEALNQVAYAGERVILERHGKPVAALVSLDDLRRLEELENQSDLAAVKAARKGKGKPVPLADVKRRLGMA